MHNTGFLMQVLQRSRNLNDDVPREILAEIGKTNDLVEELTTRAKLKDDIVVLSGFGKIYELDNILVVDLSHYLDLLENICPLQIRKALATDLVQQFE